MLQKDAEDRELVADKLASAKAWLTDLKKQQRELNADKKHLEAEREQLDEAQALFDEEDDRLAARNAYLATGV